MRERYILLVFMLAFIAAPCFLSPAFAAQSTTDEQLVLDLINDERKKADLKPLELDNKLARMAKSYCEEMATYGFFGHRSPISGGLASRLKKSGINENYLLAGENLAKSPCVKIAHEALMRSLTHKANILEPKYTHVGVGIDCAPKIL